MLFRIYASELNYTTRHFTRCPTRQALMKMTTTNNDEEEPLSILEVMCIHADGFGAHRGVLPERSHADP